MKKHIITKEQVDQDCNYIGSVNLSDFHTIELAKDLKGVVFNHSINCYFLLATTKSTIIINGDLNIKGGINVFEIKVNGNITSIGNSSGGDITAYLVTANNIESPIVNKQGFMIFCKVGLEVAGNIHCRLMHIGHINRIGGNVICEEEGSFGFGGSNIKGNAKFKYLFSKSMINVGGDLVCEKGITAFNSITAGTITATVIFAGVDPDNRSFVKDTISAKILSGKICHGNLIN